MASENMEYKGYLEELFFIRASDTIPSQQRNKTIWSGNAMEKLYK